MDPRPPLHLDDLAVRRLREAADEPDLTGTRYEMIGRIARGGMGTVYRVRDAELDRDVALKVLTVPDPDGSLAARLLAEARHLARLEHPNIVPVYDVGRLPDGRVFYAMKLVRGRRLDEVRSEGAARPALLRLFQKICGAVAFAHARGILHRDLKPENIMVGSFGEALVLDWGVAKVMQGGAPELETLPVMPPEGAAGPGAGGLRPDDEAVTLGHGATAQGAVIGTPAYMAPEQALGQADRLDARTDVYALGAILYFLVAGRPPFAGGSRHEVLRRVVEGRPSRLREVDRSVPRTLASICEKAMAAEPDRRYESAERMADDVDRFLDGQPVAAHRETVLERAGRLAVRYRTAILLVAGYLVLRMAVLLATGR
ncbi:MAG TPA: serine/threonine-protein kinase [Candidatus Polarisedimenticolia bacterium]|nr:serine/threonine-protein kinase [Candidatus Polarisedimenticolia bacterium]